MKIWVIYKFDLLPFFKFHIEYLGVPNYMATYSPLSKLSYLCKICLCLFFQKTVATYFKDNPVDIAPAYEGRASLDVNIDQRISRLSLKKLTMQDSRRYQCSVRIPGDDEGNVGAITSVLVLGESEALSAFMH